MAVSTYSGSLSLALKYCLDLSQKSLDTTTRPTLIEATEYWEGAATDIELAFAKAGYTVPLVLTADTAAETQVQKVESLLTSADAMRAIGAFASDDDILSDASAMFKRGMVALRNLIDEPTWLGSNGLTSGTPSVPVPMRSTFTDGAGKPPARTTVQTVPIQDWISIHKSDQL